MSNSFVRCQYIDHTGRECETWYPARDEENTLCPTHRGVISITAQPVPNGDTKAEYIALRNDEITLCAAMDFDALDAHIAMLEREMETLRAKTLSARGVRADKLDKLSEAERAERRKIRVSNAVKESSRPKKEPVKKDMVAKMAQDVVDLYASQGRVISFDDAMIKVRSDLIAG